MASASRSRLRSRKEEPRAFPEAELPDECLVEVLRGLTVCELLSSAWVCMRWRRVALDESLWQNTHFSSCDSSELLRFFDPDMSTRNEDHTGVWIKCTQLLGKVAYNTPPFPASWIPFSKSAPLSPHTKPGGAPSIHRALSPCHSPISLSHPVVVSPDPTHVPLGRVGLCGPRRGRVLSTAQIGQLPPATPAREHTSVTGRQSGCRKVSRRAPPPPRPSLFPPR